MWCFHAVSYAVLAPQSRPSSKIGSTDYPMLCSGPNIDATLAAGESGVARFEMFCDAQLRATTVKRSLFGNIATVHVDFSS